MKSEWSQLLLFLSKESTNSRARGPQRVSAARSAYLLIKAVLLLDDKCVVQTPGKSSYGAEQGGKCQKHEGLSDLVLGSESKASRHRTGDAPQKRDSTEEQDQLQGGDTGDAHLHKAFMVRRCLRSD